jgi:hypothetical protein
LVLCGVADESVPDRRCVVHDLDRHHVELAVWRETLNCFFAETFRHNANRQRSSVKYRYGVPGVPFARYEEHIVVMRQQLAMTQREL